MNSAEFESEEATVSEEALGAQPELVTVEPAVTAVIPGVIAMEELTGFFDRSFSQVPAVVGAQEVSIAGPAMAFYNGVPYETVNLEVGFVTDREVEQDGEVVASALPGGRVARLVHHGSFDTLGASWERLQGWITSQGLTPSDALWEVYVTEPTPDMDPADLRTELNWLVAE